MVPDGKFYGVRMGNSGKMFFNRAECDEFLKTVKKEGPRFAIFDNREDANLWLAHAIQTPKKLGGLRNITSQGPNESPLRRPRREIEAKFTGELKLKFPEPAIPLLNRLTGELRSNADQAYNAIAEEIMKNPRMLLTKAEYPVIYQAGTWSNIVHLCCQVRIIRPSLYL